MTLKQLHNSWKKFSQNKYDLKKFTQRLMGVPKTFLSGNATIKQKCRASLVAQWLRICLLMQGTQVRALVWEDPTCRGATRPVSHNY